MAPYGLAYYQNGSLPAAIQETLWKRWNGGALRRDLSRDSAML